jgi:hypothetical protein
MNHFPGVGNMVSIMFPASVRRSVELSGISVDRD